MKQQIIQARGEHFLTGAARGAVKLRVVGVVLSHDRSRYLLQQKVVLAETSSRLDSNVAIIQLARVGLSLQLCALCKRRSGGGRKKWYGHGVTSRTTSYSPEKILTALRNPQYD